jgi:uncharacterized UPF0160 family protein
MKHIMSPQQLLNAERLYFRDELVHPNSICLIKDNGRGLAVLDMDELRSRVDFFHGLRIVTHGDDLPNGQPGRHHMDEILSIALFRVLLNVPVIVTCTRKLEKLNGFDLLVDIGEGLLDHHGTRHEDFIASCTRVFLLIKQTLYEDKSYSEAQHPELYNIADIVVRVAAMDTGHEVPANPFPWLPKYVNYYRGLHSHGEMCNQSDEDVVGTMISLVSQELSCGIKLDQWKHQAFETTYQQIKDQKGKPYMVFGADAVDADLKQLIWKSKANALYYIVPEIDNTWRVCCCAKLSPQYNRFSTKQPIPVQFRGLTDHELDSAANLPLGASVFCHKQGFVAGFRSRAAAIGFVECILKENQKGA